VNLYSQSKIAAYRSVSAHGIAASADPHGLVVALFDAILGRLAAAGASIERGDIARKASLLHSSVILIAELRGSLDLARGGSLAQNLSNLYDYMARRLVHANLNSDASAVREVAGLLKEIRDAWVAIGPEVRGEASRAGSAA
jgi:flagellar protein FliS